LDWLDDAYNAPAGAARHRTREFEHSGEKAKPKQKKENLGP
jgi:hypothetical protein